MTTIGFLCFLVSVVIAVTLLVFHSLHTKGPRLTFTFFFFSLLWAFRKEAFLPASEISPYSFLLRHFPAALVTAVIILGWVFTFYLGWTLAEAIAEKTVFFRKKLFMTLLLGMFVTGAICYAAETTGITLGWWAWKIASPRFAPFLAAGTSVDAIGGWIDFFLYFMSAYFLIECSRFRKNYLALMFFLIPLGYRWFYLLREFSVIRLLAINSVILLAFFNRSVVLEYPDPPTTSLGPVVRRTPAYMALFMVLIVALLDLAVARSPAALFSVLPLTVCVLFAAGIPSPAALALCVPLMLAGKLAVPALLFTLFLFLLRISGRLLTAEGKWRPAALLTLVPLLSAAHVALSPVDALSLFRSRETITVSGEVKYADWSGGHIRIGAWSQPVADFMPPDLAHTRIQRPGPFSLTLPKNRGMTYLRAIYVPPETSGKFAELGKGLRAGEPENNPLRIGASDITGIVIFLEGN